MNGLSGLNRFDPIAQFSSSANVKVKLTTGKSRHVRTDVTESRLLTALSGLCLCCIPHRFGSEHVSAC